jgi:Dockerin type I domain
MVHWEGDSRIMKPTIAHLLIAGLAAWLTTALFGSNSYAADVAVYAEGAYTSAADAGEDEDLLEVYIYADINVPQVLSFGVRLTYNPSELRVRSAEKNVIFPAGSGHPPYTSNPALWELGDDVAYKDRPLPDYTTHSDAVIIIGGKLDELTPTAGVTGERVFLGKVTFEPAVASAPIPPAPTLSLTYAVGNGSDTYKNFVRYDEVDGDGVVIDSADSSGVYFRPINVTAPGLDIARRGDANADGVMNVNDIIQLKRVIGNSNLPPWTDCNKDGVVNVNDIIWLKRNL